MRRLPALSMHFGVGVDMFSAVRVDELAEVHSNDVVVLCELVFVFVPLISFLSSNVYG